MKRKFERPVLAPNYGTPRAESFKDIDEIVTAKYWPLAVAHTIAIERLVSKKADVRVSSLRPAPRTKFSSLATPCTRTRAAP